MKVLVVDDERRARHRLIKLMANLDWIEITGEAEHGVEALELIAEKKPDLALLDVQMPGLNGLEVVSELAGGESPLIIFVTAYDQYALQAFDVSATDYLLKPVTEERLERALVKAREILQSRTAARVALDQLQRLASAIDQQRPPYLQRVVGRRAQKLQVLPIETIQAFVTDQELVFAIAAEGRFLINHTLRELEAKLNPMHFLRVHKQTIVNLSWIAEIEPLQKAGATVRLQCGISIDVSRRYAGEFKARLEV